MIFKNHVLIYQNAIALKQQKHVMYSRLAIALYIEKNLYAYLTHIDRFIKKILKKNTYSIKKC